MRRCGRQIASRIARRDGIKITQSRSASGPVLFGDERGEGIVERGLNKLGKMWYRSPLQPFHFAQHAENKTAWDLDHISSGNEASITAGQQDLLHDKYCKWWTVEGLPGSGKKQFTDGIAKGAGLKNLGTSCLWWEHRRLREFKDEEGLYLMWDDLIKEKHHWLAMRDVYMDQFFEDPTNMVHSCRLQDHMKLQRHIHSMDALFHLLTTAEGTITNRTYHSDYCFAYAMHKMGYLSTNYYEMRYTVSCASVDGSGGATDLSPNVSFYLDISPEEAFESIKARGNEAEIKTCNLDFLKYLQEAYKGFWAEDMHNKGCTVINVDPNNRTPEDMVDLIDELDEKELRHPYSKWSHLHERLLPNRHVSSHYGENLGWLDHDTNPNNVRAGRSDIPFTRYLYLGSNRYDTALQRNLKQGPAYSYDLNYTFHPWDDLSESHSARFNLLWLNGKDENEHFEDTGKHTGEMMRNECKPIYYHPSWLPPDADWFNTGKSTPKMTIMFGSYKKFFGSEFIQARRGNWL